MVLWVNVFKLCRSVSWFPWKECKVFFKDLFFGGSGRGREETEEAKCSFVLLKLAFSLVNADRKIWLPGTFPCLFDKLCWVVMLDTDAMPSVLLSFLLEFGVINISPVRVSSLGVSQTSLYNKSLEDYVIDPLEECSFENTDERGLDSPLAWLLAICHCIGCFKGWASLSTGDSFLRTCYLRICHLRTSNLRTF